MLPECPTLGKGSRLEDFGLCSKASEALKADPKPLHLKTKSPNTAELSGSFPRSAEGPAHLWIQGFVRYKRQGQQMSLPIK